jgi:hypothetical protein
MWLIEAQPGQQPEEKQNESSADEMQAPPSLACAFTRPKP